MILIYGVSRIFVKHEKHHYAEILLTLAAKRTNQLNILTLLARTQFVGLLKFQEASCTYRRILEHHWEQLDEYNNDLTDKYAIVLAAAYGHDIELLQLAEQKLENSETGLKEYAQALVMFAKHEIGWKKKFIQCVATYRKSISSVTSAVPEYINHAANFTTVHSDQVFQPTSENSINITKREDGDFVFFVSCDTGYFFAFAEFFVRHIRIRNPEIVHFLIVIDEFDSPKAISDIKDRIMRMKEIYLGIEFSLIMTSANVGLMSSLYRFIEAENIMRQYKKDLLILDIDLKVKLDITETFNRMKEGKRKIGFPYSGPMFSPWGILNAGFCPVLFDSKTIRYLRLVSRYIEFMIGRGGRWTLDQVALYMAYEYYEKNVGKLEFLAIQKDFVWQMGRKIPKQIMRQKHRERATNLSTLPLPSADTAPDIGEAEVRLSSGP